MIRDGWRRLERTERRLGERVQLLLPNDRVTVAAWRILRRGEKMPSDGQWVDAFSGEPITEIPLGWRPLCLEFPMALFLP